MAYGSTPIEPDDQQFLTPSMQHLTTKAELDQAEASNIAKGRVWLYGESFDVDQLFDTHTLRSIHQHMFGDVWTWAGTVRRRETSIGIDPSEIQTQWEQLVRNYQWRASNADQIRMSDQDRRELGLRFHTEMVAIHVFVNGNGRHARVVANLIASALGYGSTAEPLYTWGRRSGLAHEESRRQYLEALKFAGTKGDYGPLFTLSVS